MSKIAIFASGAGSNAEKIIQYFQEKQTAEVVLLLSNKSEALALQKAEYLSINTHIFDRKTFYETQIIQDLLFEKQVDWIILAGFLWLVPPYLIKNFPNRIINLHPALLPKFGGKGMYGSHVHQAVVDAKEPQTGITIHYANEHFDEGTIIFQAICEVLPTDTAEIVAQKVQKLEHKYFPSVIEQEILRHKKI